MVPTWGRQDPGGPPDGPMNLAIKDGVVLGRRIRQHVKQWAANLGYNCSVLTMFRNHRRFSLVVADGLASNWYQNFSTNILDSKGHGANMVPIWGRQDPGGPHVGPMNVVIWDVEVDLGMLVQWHTKRDDVLGTEKSGYYF